MKAVIQAGGKGTRLLPHTLVLPKPLMPVGNWPVIELLLKWLRRNGVNRSYITVGHLGHLIKSVCKDGSQWDMKIEYSEENEPLGTVGPLKLLGREKLNESFLMLNGDLITDLNLREFMNCHRKNKKLVTVAITEKNVQVNMGVLDVREGQMVSFREKPIMNFKVSMGIYCIEPDILDLIPKGIPFGFDNLMHTMLEKNLPVNVYEHNGLWMDIGRPEDFSKAQKAFEENEGTLTGI